MNDIAIRVEHLSKRYRIGALLQPHDTLRDALASTFRRSTFKVQRPEDLWALRDVSFEVPRGEVVGIIGRNGAGKSTLLKILSRITEPTEGRVELHGRVGSLLEVGTGFHPELTGRENIYLNGAMLGMRRAEIARRFDEIVAFSEIEKFLDTPVKRYSSGMYVRLAFAVAAHLEPEILLVDEVLAVGDLEFQKKCLGKMRAVAYEGRTVVFVSHNLAAVRNLCSSAVQLDRGSIVAAGPTATVIDHYLSDGRNLSGAVAIDHPIGGAGDLQFRSVRVLDIQGQANDRVPLTVGASVELEYVVLRPLQGANVAIHLWNRDGVCVLSSTDVDQNYLSIAARREIGKYKALCYIPPTYLRAGRYEVGLSASIPNVRVLDELPRVIAFEVVDTGSIESRIAQGREGVIAPVLTWTTSCVT